MRSIKYGFMRRTVRGLLLMGVLLMNTSCPGQLKEIAHYDPDQDGEENVLLWKEFNRQYDNKWNVEWNRATGTPHRISGHSIEYDMEINKGNLKKITGDFLKKHRKLLQIDPGQLKLSKIKIEKAGPKKMGNAYVSYDQYYDGLRVYGGNVRFLFHGKKLSVINSDYFPRIRVRVSPKLDTKKVSAIAVHAVSSEEALTPEKIQLVIYPKRSDGKVVYYLAYEVTMPVIRIPAGRIAAGLEGGGKDELAPVKWLLFIDADKGTIIDRINLIRSEDLQGTVTGMVHQALPTDTPTATTLEHMNVTITQGGPPQTAATNNSGLYEFLNLNANNIDVEAHLKGPYVRVYNSETADPDATFAATTLPGVLDWNWSGYDPSPNDVETNAFHHVTLIRNWYRAGDPFDITPVSPEGPSKDYIDVHVRESYCNAYASVGGGTIEFGQSGNCEDYALCADIIYHEYTHLAVQQAYDDAGVNMWGFEHGGAFHEGFSDYFGSSITGNPHHGGGCWGGRHIDTPDMRYPDNYQGDSHLDGMIISGALWDTRAILAAGYTDNLAIRALKQTTTSFSEYLGAVLEEDDNTAYSTDPSANDFPGDGTPNINTICEAFYDNHGIYHDYCANRTQKPVAMILDPSPFRNAYNVYDASTTSITITGTAQGSLYGSLLSFTLDYAREDDLDNWLTTGVSLAGGGTVPVSNSDLGSLDISGLAGGYYLIRLTVVDTAGNTSSAITAVLIDRAYMSGWPKKLDTYFLTSPVAVDFDPAVPGLEIVARERWGRINVWHADGTPVTGWPQQINSQPVTPPTVADIDNNGTMEILAASGNTIAVLNNNGTTRPGWPQVCSDDFGRYMTPVVYDHDGDGALEIMAGTEDGTLCVWNQNGTMVSGWPVSLTGGFDSPPAIGDLDGDGSPDIVAATKMGSVTVFTAGGLVSPGWPQGSFVYSSPSLADLDGDGTLEIIAVTAPNVSAWHYDGSPVQGWPQSAPNSGQSPLLAIGDVNSDGSPEIILQARATIHVWTAGGSLLPAAPFDICGLNCSTNPLSPAAGDVDGNGTTEIVATRDFWKIGRTWQEHALYGSRTANKFFAFDQNGVMAPGFPKYGLSRYSPSSPIIADIDQDGSTELMVAGYGVHIWDLPGTYSEDAMEWPEYRHDPWHTGLYGSIPPPPPSVIYVDSSIGSDSYDGSSPTYEGGNVGPKQTIQAGIDATSAGQTCQVAAGTYTETITMKEGILLNGAGAAVTVVDGGGNGPVVTGANNSEIDGFTITGASPDGFPDAAGIYCEGTSMPIKNNIISNIALYPVFVRDASPLIQSNTIIGSGNNGIYNSAGSGAIIRNNLIYDSADAGIYCLNSSDTLQIENNTIVKNKFGINVQNCPPGITITNNIIAGNNTGIYVSGNAPSLSYNDVWNSTQNYTGSSPGPGDISLDPLFVDPVAHDYHLQAGSPCIDAGTDVGQPYSGSAPDMGAFEFE